MDTGHEKPGGLEQSDYGIADERQIQVAAARTVGIELSAISASTFNPPRNGTALRIESAVPPTTPLRRIAEPIATSASAVPMNGTERDSRRAARRCP